MPGGQDNLAYQNYTFAAGRRAKANNKGCFVWGDSTDADVTCDNDNRWVARASGGVYFYTDSTGTTGSYLSAGSGTWTSRSDRDLKENFASVSGREVLEKVAAIPLTTWNYKTEGRSIRHMGPMAQDLYVAFGLGDSEKSIATIDADGVALGAIQGLYEIVKEKEAELESLRAEKDAQITALEARLLALEEAIAAVPRKDGSRGGAR